MKLYSYWRSSSAYRVRIALNLKGLKAEIVPVNLLKGEQKSESYRMLNPQGLVPALVEGEHGFTQSLAIIAYLDEMHPAHPLMPLTPPERAHVRALAMAIVCEVAPLCNLGTMKYLEANFKLTEEQKTRWYHDWMGQGFTALEQMLATSPYTGSFCHGAQATLADCCLVPQVYNAQRFGVDMGAYPNVMRIFAHCEKHPAFIAAHPSRQVDAA